MRLLALCLALIDDESDKIKFEELYWEYKDLMFYCANEKLHDTHRAEEAVSDAFIHVAKNMSMVDEVKSPRTKRLLVIIVERTAINMYNKYQKEYNRTVDIEDMEHLSMDDFPSDGVVAQAILQLPLQYRQAIILKYSLGYDNREISAILDCSVAKVEKLLSRGKKQLEKILEEMSHETG